MNQSSYTSCVTARESCLQPYFPNGSFSNMSNTTATASTCTAATACMANYFRCLESVATGILQSNSGSACSWARSMTFAVFETQTGLLLNSTLQQACFAAENTTILVSSCSSLVSSVQSNLCGETSIASTATSSTGPSITDIIGSTLTTSSGSSTSSSTSQAATVTTVLPNAAAVYFVGRNCSTSSSSSSCGVGKRPQQLSFFHAAWVLTPAESTSCYARPFDFTVCSSSSTATSRRQTSSGANVTGDLSNSTASFFSEKILSDGTTTCLKANVVTGQCSCPTSATINSNRTFLLPLPDDKSSSDSSVLGRITFCVNDETSFFIRGTLSGGCYVANVNDTCSCQSGSPRLDLPITFYNSTTQAAEMGMLTMCATVKSSVVASSASAIAVGVVTTVAGGPLAGSIQGAGILTGMRCATDGAKSIGGKSAAVPFTIGNGREGGAVALIVVGYGVLLLHFIGSGIVTIVVYRRRKKREAEIQERQKHQRILSPAGSPKSRKNRSAEEGQTSLEGSTSLGALGKLTSIDAYDFALAEMTLSQEAFATARFPNFSLRILKFAVQGLLFESISLFTNSNPNGVEILVGVIGLLSVLVYGGLTAYFSVKVGLDLDLIRLLFKRYEKAFLNIPKAVQYLFLPAGFWRMSHHMSRRFEPFFDSFVPERLLVFGPLSVIQPFLTSLIAALPSQSQDSCRAIYISLAVIYFVATFIILIGVPHRRRLDNLTTVFFGVITGLLSLAIGIPEAGMDPATLFAVVLWGTLAATALLIIFFAVEYVKWRKEEKGYMLDKVRKLKEESMFASVSFGNSHSHAEDKAPSPRKYVDPDEHEFPQSRERPMDLDSEDLGAAQETNVEFEMLSPAVAVEPQRAPPKPHGRSKTLTPLDVASPIIVTRPSEQSPSGRPEPSPEASPKAPKEPETSPQASAPDPAPGSAVNRQPRSGTIRDDILVKSVQEQDRLAGPGKRAPRIRRLVIGDDAAHPVEQRTSVAPQQPQGQDSPGAAPFIPQLGSRQGIHANDTLVASLSASGSPGSKSRREFTTGSSSGPSAFPTATVEATATAPAPPITPSATVHLEDIFPRTVSNVNTTAVATSPRPVEGQAFRHNRDDSSDYSDRD
jgi:hypothetical protein